MSGHLIKHVNVNTYWGGGEPGGAWGRAHAGKGLIQFSERVSQLWPYIVNLVTPQ